MICARHNIWTLSGDYRSRAMFSWWKIYIYIFRVYHIRIIAKKNGSHDMKQTDSSIIIVRNVCVLTSASMIVYLFFTRSWSAIIGGGGGGGGARFAWIVDSKVRVVVFNAIVINVHRIFFKPPSVIKGLCEVCINCR